MTDIWLLIVCAVVSYLIGCINWALVISKIKNKDIRKLGSGNPGTLNMSRNFGLKIGLLTLLLDVLKGAVPTLCAFFIFRNKIFPNSSFYISDFAMYMCGFFAVIGHIYPFWLKFKGGKGIATTIGVFLVCECVHGNGWAIVPVMALVAAALFIYFTEFGAMGSFIAITPPAISGCIRLVTIYGKDTSPITITFYIITSCLILAICLLTWFAHRKNIERMLAGEEHPTSIKEMIVKMKMKKKQKEQNDKNEQSENFEEKK